MWSLQVVDEFKDKPSLVLEAVINTPEYDSRCISMTTSLLAQIIQTTFEDLLVTTNAPQAHVVLLLEHPNFYADALYIIRENDRRSFSGGLESCLSNCNTLVPNGHLYDEGSGHLPTLLQRWQVSRHLSPYHDQHFIQHPAFSSLFI